MINRSNLTEGNVGQAAEVEVFQTSIISISEASRISDLLKTKFPFLKINFDLDDCDNILRIESGDLLPKESIIEIVRNAGHNIKVLE